jgi:ribosome-associated protein
MTDTKKVLDVLTELKFQDIFIYDVHQSHPFSDTIIIATLRNPRSLAAAIKAFKTLDEKTPLQHIEGTSDSSWVLIVLDGIILHLMTQEDRDYYHLEKLWFDYPMERFESE